MCVLLPHLLYIYIYRSELEGHIPDWLMILTSVMYFGYMNLDNIDGK